MRYADGGELTADERGALGISDQGDVLELVSGHERPITDSIVLGRSQCCPLKALMRLEDTDRHVGAFRPPSVRQRDEQVRSSHHEHETS
jgi:hypothetical protein